VEPISASPSPILFGTVVPESVVDKKLILRGEQEFRIVSINCSDSRVSWEIDEAARKLHIIPVQFSAGAESSQLKCHLEIITDCGEAKCVEIKLEADIKSE